MSTPPLYYTIDIVILDAEYNDVFDVSGIFTVDPVTKFLTSFYDLSASAQVLPLPTDPSYGSFNADYQYLDGWKGFSGYGINLKSLSGIPNVTGSVLNIWGDFTIDEYGGIIFNNGDNSKNSRYVILPVTDEETLSVYRTSYPPVITVDGPFISNLSAIQVQSIIPSALGELTQVQYQAFTTNQLSVMSKVQINGFTSPQKSNFSQPQLSAIVRPPNKTLWYSINIQPISNIDQYTPVGSFYGYLSVESDSYDITGVYDFSNPGKDIIYRKDRNTNGANFSFRYIDFQGNQNVAGGGVTVIGMPLIVSDIYNYSGNTAYAIDFYGAGSIIGMYYQKEDATWGFYQQGSYSVQYALLSGNPYRIPCFGEDSEILTLDPETNEEKMVLVQDVRKGTLVKTPNNGFLPVDMIGRSTIKNSNTNERIQTRLYTLSKDKYPELSKDLVLTGCHSILVDHLSDEEKEKTTEHLGQLYVTDRKYRLMTFLDERAVPLEKEGEFPIYHIALENEDYYMNYGMYANGLLVESCSKRYLKELSNMTLL